MTTLLNLLIRDLWTYKMVEDLVAQDADHVKGLLGSDRVNEHVAMNADEMFGVEDAVFILEGSRC